MSIKSSLCGTWIALAVVLSGCAPELRSPPARDQAATQDGRPAARKRIVAAIMGDPPTLSNTINSAGAAGVPGASEVERLVNAGLTRVDPDGRLHPQLAESVPSIENGLWRVDPDGQMETTWRVRSGAVWHDGTPFSTEDLVFSVRVGQDRDLAIFHDISFDSIDRVEAPDPRTLVARWKKPFIQADALFSTDAITMPFPRHVLERPYLDNKAALPQLPYWSAEYVGVGPYQLREWVRGSHLVLAADDRYVLGRPKIDEIEVRLIPDSNALAANILAGTVELTLGRNLSLDEAIQVSDQWRDGRMERRFTSWIVMYPQLLTPQPSVVGDVRFRRAMLHAIDRQAMADSLLRPGLSSVAHLFLGPNEPAFKDVEGSAVRYEYDPRRAAQLMDELGYRLGTDGLVRDGANQALTVEIRNRGIEIGTKSMFVSADYWKRVGVGVETVVVPTQRAQDRPYMAAFPGFLLYNQPADVNFLKRIHGSQTPLPENSFVGQNNSRYVNAEFDALIDRHFVTILRHERVQVLGQIVYQLTDQVLLLGLFYNPEAAMIGNRLQNAAAGPPWNAHEWDVRN
jgi:peptide/nickel transport system substrate-binding protein